LSIAVGPDGALWFTEGRAGQIGRITTAGEISEYALPTPYIPYSITAGPDGALWFIEGSLRFSALLVHGIARITTDGVITEYPLPRGVMND
jgi:virginiamycin B lyase